MNNRKITIQDFRDICLTCLQVKNNLISIYNSKAGDMLTYCNLCLILEKDNFPKKICSACIQMLTQSYEFKQMIENSFTTLNTLLSGNGNTEPITSVELQNSKSLSVLNNSEDTSEDASDSTNDALMVKCEEPTTILFDNDTSYNKDCSDLSDFKNEEVFLKFYKKNCNSVRQFENNEESQENTNEDLISFLDKPLPPPLQYCCQKCDESFSEENDLKIHQSVHSSELICIACSKKFANKQILKRHLKIHLIKKPHICKICNKSFAESYALTKHLRRHSGIPREKRHICTECGQGFSEPYYLKVHLRKHTGERPLICSQCFKPFADPRSLKIHSMIHTGEKPHKCNICLKSFIQRANLTKHLRTHTGEKPYLCKICDKRFSQSSTLGKHLRTHTGEKLHSCDKCGKRYSDKTALINHLKSHIADRNFPLKNTPELLLDFKEGNKVKIFCRVCGKKFPTDAVLQEHLHTHYECNLCFKKFISKSSLAKHSKIHEKRLQDSSTFANSCIHFDKPSENPLDVNNADNLYAANTIL